MMQTGFLKCLMIISILSLGVVNVNAKQPAPDVRLKKGNVVYIHALDKGEYKHVAHAIGYWGYWKITENAQSADFILDVRTSPGWNYKAYAVLEDAHTGEEIYRTRPVNTLWTSSSINTKAGAMRKLVNKRLRRNYVNKIPAQG